MDTTLPAITQKRLPVGTLILVGLTLAVSLLQSMTSVALWIKGLGVVPADVARWALLERAPGHWAPTLAACLTWMLPHGGWWHVLPNMTALLLFGIIAEEKIGTPRWVAAYLVIGALSPFALGMVLPNDTQAVAGASCAISGVVGVYLADCLKRKGLRKNFARLIVGGELSVVALVAMWLIAPHATATPGLAESVIYHFIPFIAGWLIGRYSGEVARSVSSHSTRLGT